MAYCAQLDCERAAGGLVNLLALTDINALGTIDGPTLDTAILEADTWIDTFAQRRHATPFNPVPSSIKLLSAAEAVYRLKKSKTMASEQDAQEHEERRLWLRDLSTGVVSPGTDPSPPKSTAVVPQVLERSTEEDVSRDSLKGFV